MRLDALAGDTKFGWATHALNCRHVPAFDGNKSDTGDATKKMPKRHDTLSDSERGSDADLGQDNVQA